MIYYGIESKNCSVQKNTDSILIRKKQDQLCLNKGSGSSKRKKSCEVNSYAALFSIISHLILYYPESVGLEL